VTPFQIAAVSLCSLLAGALLTAQAPGGSGASNATVRDGVYNEEQAKRGRATYDAKCGACHDGGTMGPELWGDPFLTGWENKPVGAFFTRVQTTMPEDAPGSLTEDEVLDLVAYVIQMNGFPAGEKPLQAGALAVTTWVRK
jgi:mono/diheme cytochrome c family protein